MTSVPHLISHHLCPYVQRAVIALTEKRVAYRRSDIDLADKPDWFLALSPLGKVPVLEVDGTALFESAVIVEYLEDTTAPALHPRAPLERARHRAWIEVASSILNDIAGFYGAATPEHLETKRVQLTAKFQRLEAALGAGPYFAGEAFSLVDAAFGPTFRYLDIFEQIGAFGFLAEAPKTSRYRLALSRRPSVRDAVALDYSERLLAFIRRRGGALARLAAASAAAPSRG